MKLSGVTKDSGIKIIICIQTLKYAMVLRYLDGILRVSLVA